MTKKRGYFFTLDAVLALSVLIIGFFLIVSFYIDVPQPAQVGFLSDDLLNFLSNTKIKDLNNPYGGIGGELWKQVLITNEENSLLQQIGEFYTTNKLDVAERLILNISQDVLPSQYAFEVWIDSTLIYPRIPSQAHLKSRNSTRLLLTSKKIAFGILNETTSDLWGPYKAEVFVWESGNVAVAYFTSSSICQNAENLGLCDGLDIIYGIGYESACCSEHSLCC